jgi:hypothetical protein
VCDVLISHFVVVTGKELQGKIQMTLHLKKIEEMENKPSFWGLFKGEHGKVRFVLLFYKSDVCFDKQQYKQQYKQTNNSKTMIFLSHLVSHKTPQTLIVRWGP